MMLSSRTFVKYLTVLQRFGKNPSTLRTRFHW